MRNRPTPQMAQKPHRGTEKFFRLSLCLCGFLWFCGVAVHAETLRDPFTFAPSEDTVEKQPSVKLMGVLWDATHPLAMVGDQAIGIGDHVGDWEVVEIQATGIVIQRGARRETVATGSPLPAD